MSLIVVLSDYGVLVVVLTVSWVASSITTAYIPRVVSTFVGLDRISTRLFKSLQFSPESNFVPLLHLRYLFLTPRDLQKRVPQSISQVYIELPSPFLYEQNTFREVR